MSEPKLRFKNFNQALVNSPFERYIKSSKYGPRFDANDYDLNGNVKTIRGTDVALDATIKYEQVPIANLPQKLIDEHQLQEGDILMITTADCGLSAVFEKQEIPFIASAYAVRIVLNDSLDSLWVKYYLQTQHIINEVNKYVRKGTLSNLPLSDISKFSFTVPTLEEQTKIASFLFAVDKKISQLNQIHELLSQYKQGMMQKLFSQQIRFKADDGSEFGEWEETVLDKIGTFLKGKGISKADIVKDGFTPCIRYGELYTHYGEVISNVFSATNLEIKNLILSKANDVLIPASGETQIDIATASCVLHDDVALSGDLNIFRTKENGVFLSYLIRSHLKMQIAQLAQGNSVVHLYSSQLKGVRLNLPCLEEQTKIANFLSEIDQKIEVVAQQIEQAKQWKKGLLQQMFV